MANTFIEYSGDGSTTDYNIPFDYIKQAEVKVTINGVATTAFTFPTAGQIRLTDPANPDTNNATIRVYRETDVSDLKAEFFAVLLLKLRISTITSSKTTMLLKSCGNLLGILTLKPSKLMRHGQVLTLKLQRQQPLTTGLTIKSILLLTPIFW